MSSRPASASRAATSSTARCCPASCSRTGSTAAASAGSTVSTWPAQAPTPAARSRVHRATWRRRRLWKTGAMVLDASRTVEVDAPMGRCYELAADIEGAPEWQETLLDVEVLDRDDEGRPLLVETLTDAMVKKARTTVRFSYDPPNGLSWEQEKGDAKWLKGRWEFEDLGDGRT